jgi:hypothetical protein
VGVGRTGGTPTFVLSIVVMVVSVRHLPAFVESVFLSVFFRVVYTLPFDVSVFVESVWMRVRIVVSCGTVGVVPCACANAGVATMAATAMNLSNMIPASLYAVQQ